MNIDRSPNSSSSFQRDDSEAGLTYNSAMQHSPVAEPAPGPSRPNRLFAIDDLDFEALIEILGTDEEKERGKKAVNLQAMPLLAQESQQDEVPHAMPASNRPVAEAVDTSSSSKPVPLPSVKQNRQSSPLPRASSSDPHQSHRRTQSPGNSRVPSKTGFTQLKGQLDTSVLELGSQVTELRSRMLLLKDQVKEFAPHVYRRAFDAQHERPQCPSERLPLNGRQVDEKNDVNVGRPSRVEGGNPRDVISAFAEDEAKAALLSICQTLRLDPSKLTTTSSESSQRAHFAPPSDHSDIARALQLTTDMDELIWRNSNKRDLQIAFSDDRNRHNIYEEENIQAILDRARLWERTARSRVARRPGP